MSEILFEFERDGDFEMQTERFACGCLDPTHALDFTIGFSGDRPLLVEFSSRFLPRYGSLWDRLSMCWRTLRGQNLYDHDVIIRSEDFHRFSSLMEKQEESKA